MPATPPLSIINPVSAYVGSRIRSKRIQLNQEIAVFAYYLRCSEADYLARESGEIRLSAQELFLLCQIFDVPVSYYYEGLTIVADTPAALNRY